MTRTSQQDADLPPQSIRASNASEERSSREAGQFLFTSCVYLKLRHYELHYELALAR